jgi:hypothetical protein
MKRTEELIHLSKKIHFEGKVWAAAGGMGSIRAALAPSLPRETAGQLVSAS